MEKQVLKQHKAEQERGERDFVAYFAALADKRKVSNYDNWISALNYLKAFMGEHSPHFGLSQTVESGGKIRIFFTLFGQ